MHPEHQAGPLKTSLVSNQIFRFRFALVLGPLGQEIALRMPDVPRPIIQSEGMGY